MAAGIKNAAFVKTRISIACADTSWGGGSRSVIKWKMFLVLLLSFRSSFYFSNNFLIDIPKVLKNCKIQILPKKKKKFILESYVRSDSDSSFLLIFLEITTKLRTRSFEISFQLIRSHQESKLHPLHPRNRKTMILL